MNERIAAFCWRAVTRGILTPGQCLVLRELFTDQSTIEDCVDFIVKNTLVDDKKLKALELQAKTAPKEVKGEKGVWKSTTGEVIAGEEPPGEAPLVREAWAPDPGLEWFCYLIVSNGLVTREICLCLVADMDMVVDLLSFAQAMVDTGLCQDLQKVQQLTDEALEQWARGNKPPMSIFAKAG